MLKTSQILVSAITLGACVLNLAGCGQTGALYLPAPTGSSQPKSAPPVKATEPSSASGDTSSPMR